MVRFRVVERSVVVDPALADDDLLAARVSAESTATRCDQPVGVDAFTDTSAWPKVSLRRARRRDGPDDLADPVDRPPAAELEPENPPGRDLRRLVGRAPRIRREPDPRPRVDPVQLALEEPVEPHPDLGQRKRLFGGGLAEGACPRPSR